MMQILVISPQSDLIASLQKALSRVKTLGRAVILRQYPSPGQLVKLLHAKRPRVIVVGLSEPNQALELIEGLRAGYPEIPVAASHVVNSPNLILAAVRAGASEYLGPPFDMQHLEQIALAAAEADTKTRPQGRLIAFLPVQGGCGASTIALHVAAALSRESGKRTLLLDFDSHSGTVDFRLRLKPQFTLADALQRTGCLDNLWGQLACHWKGLDVLPAAPLEPLTRAEHYGRTSAVLVSARRVYEWVVSDLPPAIYTSCLDLLAKAEAVYVVCTPELVSLHLARRKARELRSIGLADGTALRLVVNRVGSRHSLNPREMEQTVDIPLAWAFPNDYAAVSSAAMKARLVPEGSLLGQQYAGFVRHLTGIPAPGPPSRSPGWKKLLSQIGTMFPSCSPLKPIEVCGPSTGITDI